MFVKSGSSVGQHKVFVKSGSSVGQHKEFAKSGSSVGKHKEFVKDASLEQFSWVMYFFIFEVRVNDAMLLTCTACAGIRTYSDG